MTEWFEDETFWVKLYPFIFPEQKFAIADDQVASILKLVGLEGGSVLDLACGPGRHATALAQEGIHGDRSRPLVRSSANGEGPSTH